MPEKKRRKGPVRRGQLGGSEGGDSAPFRFRGGICFFVGSVLEFRMDLEKQNRETRVLG